MGGWNDRPAGCFCCAPTACATPTVGFCSRRPASSCAAIAGRWPRSWIIQRHGCKRRRNGAGAALLPAAGRCGTPVPVPPLVMENGIGGFTPDGREYVVVLEGDRETPLPWSNVLANPDVRHDASARPAPPSPGPRTAARID